MSTVSQALCQPQIPIEILLTSVSNVNGGDYVTFLLGHIETTVQCAKNHTVDSSKESTTPTPPSECHVTSKKLPAVYHRMHYVLRKCVIFYGQ